MISTSHSSTILKVSFKNHALRTTILLVLESLWESGGRAAVAHPGNVNTGGGHTEEHSAAGTLLLEANFLAHLH